MGNERLYRFGNRIYMEDIVQYPIERQGRSLNESEVRPVWCCEPYECPRNVIVLDPTLKIDEVDMSYKSFIVQFSGLIIKKIIKDKGWTITKAHNFLKSKFMFDQYVYDIMQEIVTEREVKFILNRNPKMCGVVKIQLIAGKGTRCLICINMIWMTKSSDYQLIMVTQIRAELITQVW